jgi:hypothetical protein
LAVRANFRATKPWRPKAGSPYVNSNIVSAWPPMAERLPCSRRTGGDALTKLRMPNGKPLGSCTVEYHKRVGQFLGVIGRMGSLHQRMEDNATLRDLGVL